VTEEPTSAYWFAEAGIRELLEAVRRFRRADQQMRRRASAAMGMNVTDMQALQEVIAAERRGVLVTANLLATNLGISTASTTKLLDRLTASGHLERRPHPHDRRAVVVVATEHAHCEVRSRLTNMHDVMAQIAAAVPPGSRADVAQFLTALAAHLDDVEGPDPLTPV